MELLQHTDIMVVGGGAAGVAAAVAASGKGLKVTLLERCSFLGGKATAAEVGTICGLYAYNTDGNSTYLSKGFARDFAERLRKRSGTVPLNNSEGLHYLPYEINDFKTCCLEVLRENNVEVLLDTVLDNVSIISKKLGSVTYHTAGNHFTRPVVALVDCTGDAVISRLSGTEIIKSDQYQAAAQVFTLENITEENESRLGLILMKALRVAIDEKKLPDYYDRVYIVQGSLKHNSVSLKLGIPVSVNYEAGNLEKIQESAIEFVQQLSGFIIKNIPAFREAVIKSIAPEVGIRVGTRTLGEYILTEQDVLNCRKFDDAVAYGSWPIEEWEQHKRVKMKYFKPGDHYHVPSGCLVSKHISNLFMGGRNISASELAIASARVIGTCLQTGFAAGYLAAGYAMGMDQQAVIANIQKLQL